MVFVQIFLKKSSSPDAEFCPGKTPSDKRTCCTIGLFNTVTINFGMYLSFDARPGTITFLREDSMDKRTVSRLPWITIVVIMIVCACSITGCMTNAPSGGTGPGQQSTITAAPTLTATRPAPGSVKAVDFNLLIPFLPNAPTGWTAEDPDGMTMNIENGSWTTASRSYSSGDEKRATVSIMDSAYYAVGGWEMWGHQYEMTTTEGYFKSGTVAGFPSWESHDIKSKSYGTLVGLNNRFMVSVTIDNGEKVDLDLFLNSINYQGIAALK